MKRNQKLMLLLLVLIVLGAAAYGLPKLLPEEGIEEEPDTSVTLLSLDPETVTAISWTYDAQTVSLVKQDAWAYAEDSAFPLDTAFVDDMLDELSEVEAAKTIEEPEELAQYGLERPVCTIQVTADQEYEILLGDETSMGGQRYLSIGDGKVYLADDNILDCFTYGLYDLIQPETVPNMEDVLEMSVSASSQTLELCYLENSGLAYSDQYVWFERTQDGYKVLDTELTESLISTVTSVSWNSCVDYKAQDHLADYGLDSPRATASVRYLRTIQVKTGQTDENGDPVYEDQTEEALFTLEIGSDTDQGSYARLAGSGMVYQIDSDICETLLYTTDTELQPDEPVLLDWDAVTAVDVTLDGAAYHMEKVTREVTDDDGNTTEETVYQLNGTEIALEDVLKKLDRLKSTGYTGGIAPERSMEIRFVFFRDNEAYPETELCFYSYDSSSCLTELNGVSTLFVSRADVLDIVEAVNQLLMG